MRLRRGLQTVAVPVFQFGVFSDTDLTFYGGDDFDFGGRVHTNGNLWLSEARRATLLFTDRITAYGDVNRRYLSNGLEAADQRHERTRQDPHRDRQPRLGPDAELQPEREQRDQQRRRLLDDGDNPRPYGGRRTVLRNDAHQRRANSVVDDRFADVLRRQHHQPAHRRDGAAPAAGVSGSGADRLDQAARSRTKTPSTRLVFGQRYFGAWPACRILLSDRAEDITNLPTVTGDGADVLDGDWLTAHRRVRGPWMRPIRRSPARSARPPTATDGRRGRAPTRHPLRDDLRDRRHRRGIPGAATMTVTWPGAPRPSRGCTGRTITTFTGCTVSAADSRQGRHTHRDTTVGPRR